MRKKIEKPGTFPGNVPAFMKNFSKNRERSPGTFPLLWEKKSKNRERSLGTFPLLWNFFRKTGNVPRERSRFYENRGTFPLLWKKKSKNRERSLGTFPHLWIFFCKTGNVPWERSRFYEKSFEKLGTFPGNVPAFMEIGERSPFPVPHSPFPSPIPRSRKCI